jgi:hypothetical protein
MAEVVTHPGWWSHDVALATPPSPRLHPAGLDRLPSEWVVVDGVSLRSGAKIDHVVIGPNGVFTLGVDPETMPADIGDDGIYRNGVRVTIPVKHALRGAHELRGDLGLAVIAYPILVTPLRGEHHRLDRLGVVPGERIAEHIWSHPGFPMRRSQRAEVLWTLRRFTT